MRCCTSWTVRTVAVLAVLLGAFGLQAGASATLLIEKPYGELGLYRNRPRGRLPVRRLRANTPDPSAVCSRRIRCCAKPV
jgi:hypothetical protein